MLTVAAVLGLTITPRRFLTTVGWLALGVFAVGTIADSRLPLRCSTAACEATQVPLTHQWHAVTSTVSVTAAVVSAVAFIIAIFVYRAPRAMWWSGLAVVVLFLVGTLWMLVGVDDPSGSHSWLGFAQRVELLSMSGWMVLVAATLLSDRAWRPCTGRPRRPSPSPPDLAFCALIAEFRGSWARQVRKTRDGGGPWDQGIGTSSGTLTKLGDAGSSTRCWGANRLSLSSGRNSMPFGKLLAATDTRRR
ncbi:DUF998 domain-containing protein [Rhodococcus hoagii]|nr:DUF998 domain-containing protein [Prescottella equi]